VDCILVEHGSGMVGGCLALRHPPQCPSCTGNTKPHGRKCVWPSTSVSQPSTSVGMNSFEVGGAEEGPQTGHDFNAHLNCIAASGSVASV
jgi:hypothetical protein